MSIKARIELEKRIVREIAKAALEKGWTASVYDGEEWALRISSDLSAIMAAIYSTDEDQLILRDADGKRMGWIRLVYGNDGWDVINDYSTALEEFLKPINNFAEEYA